MNLLKYWKHTKVMKAVVESAKSKLLLNINVKFLNWMLHIEKCWKVLKSLMLSPLQTRIQFMILINCESSSTALMFSFNLDTEFTTRTNNDCDYDCNVNVVHERILMMIKSSYRVNLVDANKNPLLNLQNWFAWIGSSYDML